MLHLFARTELLIGKEALEKLKQAKVAIFGIGGVGSFVIEGLVRLGIESFILVDKDIVSETNMNRQLIATTKTIGRKKVEVAKERIYEINPNAKVESYQEFYLPEKKGKILDATVSYVIDAMDTVTAKLALIEETTELQIPIISCMGTGNKLDPFQFEITEIEKTSVCPLAKVMRKELRKRKIEKVKVLYSKEEPRKPKEKIEEYKSINKDRRIEPPGSISFVPSIAGLMIAGEVMKDIIK